MRGFCDKLRAILLIRELNSLSVDIIYVHSVTVTGIYFKLQYPYAHFPTKTLTCIRLFTMMWEARAVGFQGFNDYW